MGSFTADVTRFVEKTKLRGEQVVKKLALDAFKGVVMRSPVDTGRFRSNWRVGVNAIDMTTTPAPPSAPVSMSPADASAVAAAMAKMAPAKWGDMIVISNNLHYGPRLERGWSRQAPHGMLIVTFEELKASLSRTVQALGGNP